MAAYDLVIRNGRVADGTGKKMFAADVAVKGDRIAAVDAPGSLKGDNEIDAKGKVVAPGFIDVHTHDDTALIDNPTMASPRSCAAIAASRQRRTCGPMSATGCR
jgi:N-acyl-D-amino-acid deacylase